MVKHNKQKKQNKKNKQKKQNKQKIDLANLPSYDVPYQSNYWSGEKFPGGFGVTKDFEIVDYWTLRKRSKQLFNENLYARGLIRRLITNEINKGLKLEAMPDNIILGISDEEADKFAETIERRFEIWGKSEKLCDYSRQEKFAAIQRNARMMAIVSGDVLVVLRTNKNGTPNVQLIDAENVKTPMSDSLLKEIKARGNTIDYGVELNQSKRHIAYYVQNEKGKYTRIPVNTSRTGRKQAFLYYGTEKLIGQVRGQSLLGLVMQSLKEIDRYRDSEQRAAVINAMLALWIEKGEDKMSSTPFSQSATRKDTIQTQNDSQGRKDVEFSAQMPGLIFQELQHGEKPHSYDTKRPNVNFAVFEEAIINAIAWANEMPPEIMTLGFSSNYSASQAAVSEFKMYLEKMRDDFGDNFLSYVYEDFFLAEILNDNIKADGFLEAYRTNQWDKYGAWVMSNWAGAIKPSIDLLKTAKAYGELYDRGWVTADRASRDITGMKYSKVIQQQKRENEQKAIAQKPLQDAGLIADLTNIGVSNG